MYNFTKIKDPNFLPVYINRSAFEEVRNKLPPLCRFGDIELLDLGIENLVIYSPFKIILVPKELDK